MTKITRLTHGMVALSMLFSVAPSNAQVRVRTGGIGVVAVPQNPGDYNYSQYDESRLQTEVLNVLEKRSAEDKAYVLEQVRLLNMAVNDIIDSHVKSGLQKMSDDSLTGGISDALSPVTFMAAKRSFEASLEKINTLTAGISAMPSIMKSTSSASINVKQNLQAIQARFNIDMAPLIKNYESQTQALVDRISKLSFRIKGRNGVIFDQVGLIPNDKFKANQYTAEEITAERKKAAVAKMVGTDEEKALFNMNLFMLRNLNATIDSYGQAYRINLDENGKLAALKSLEEIFFMRSILRAQYGIPLGVPKLNYELKTFNWDFFSSSNKMTFSQASLMRSEELVPLHNVLANALVAQDGRSKEVFGDNNNVFARVTSAITFLKGERARAGMNVIMLKLLVADLEEDMAVGRAGGRREMRALIQKRYYGTKENETHFKELGRNLVGGSKDAWADAGQVSANTMTGIYRAIEPIMKGHSSRVEQANAQLEALDEMDKAAVGRRETINDDLFK